jgi:hypothetical protein
VTDILDLIDQAVSDEPTRCWQCHGQLGDSVSDDFCSQDCQTAWHAAQSEPLVGYREPDDLGAHYSHEPTFFDHSAPVLSAHRLAAMSAALDRQILYGVTASRTEPTPASADTLTYEHIVRMYERLIDQPQRPRAFRFTQQQWDQVHAALPGAPDNVPDPTGSSIFATPIELVDHVEDSTPYQQGSPGTYTINTTAWSTRAGIIYDIPSRGRCLITDTPSVTPDQFIRGATHDSERVGITLTGDRFIVTTEFLDQGCTRVALPARFVGGPFHDDTTPAPDPAPDQVQRLVPTPINRIGDPVETQAVVYRRHHSDGRYWYYILDTPDRRDRTIPADDNHPELRVRHLQDNFRMDQSLVEVTGGDWRGRSMLPNELLADDNAVRGWFGGQRSAALARAETEAYNEAERREPGLLQRRRDALRPRVGNVVDHLPHEGLYVHEYAGTDERSWFTPEQVRALFERPPQPVVAREHVIPIGEPYRPWLPSQITPRRPERSLYEGTWTPAAPNEPLLILAGNLTQARNIAEIDLGLPSRQWRYLFDERQLRGRQGGSYYLSPTFSERRDADHLLAVARTRGMTAASADELEARRAASR